MQDLPHTIITSVYIAHTQPFLKEKKKNSSLKLLDNKLQICIYMYKEIKTDTTITLIHNMPTSSELMTIQGYPLTT